MNRISQHSTNTQAAVESFSRGVGEMVAGDLTAEPHIKQKL